MLPVSAARLDESVQDSTAMGKDIQWIVDEAQLRGLAERVNNGETMEGKNFTLGEDITLTQDWTPIGTSDHPFKGTFDGFQGIISGLKVSQDDDCSGLFGYNMGVIMNVNVEVETLSGKDYVGAIAGCSTGQIRCCSSRGKTVSGSKCTGGIVGSNTGLVYNCKNECSIVSSGDFTGGIAGYSNGTINYAANNNTVSGNKAVGGIVGYQKNDSLENCVSINTISGTEQVGGIVGYCLNANVNFCVNDSTVNGSYKVGGVIGEASCTINQCVNKAVVTCATVSGGEAKAGGIAGEANLSTISKCANRVKISSGNQRQGNQVGGIAGSAHGNISDCYDSAIVFATHTAGGLVGYSKKGTFTRCFTKAPEKNDTDSGKYGIDCDNTNSTSSGRTGALVGLNEECTFKRCYWYSSCAKRGIGNVSSSGTHTGDDYDYYYYQSRFKDESKFKEWDFTSVWYIDQNAGYPRLQFEKNLGAAGTFDTLFAGDGSEINPFHLGCAEHWYKLANYVSRGVVNSTHHFIQMANFKVSSSVGTTDKPFTGVYDGNGFNLNFIDCSSSDNVLAPFVAAKNATFRHLGIIGTLTADNKFAAGLIGTGYGKIDIIDCRSSVTIKSPVAGDGTHGGFIAVTSNDSDVTIEGCVFNGKLLGSNTANCGGFVGYARNLLNIKNSLFAPSEVTITGDEKGKAVAVNNNQFIMPDSNVTVKASFVFAPYIKGDANGDGVVNISDVTEIQRLLAKAKTDPDGMITLRANVTDGKLNIDDATAIQRYIAGYSKNPYHIGEKVEK